MDVGPFDLIFKQLEDIIGQAVLLLYLAQASMGLSFSNLPSSFVAVRSAIPIALAAAVEFSSPQALRVSPSGQFVALDYGGSILVSTLGGKVLSKPIPTDGSVDGFGWCCGERVLVRRFAEKGHDRHWCIYALDGTPMGRVAVDTNVQEVLQWKISPDGHYLAYTGNPKRGGSFSLLVVVKLCGKPTTVLKRPFAFTIEPHSLFWSADSKKVCALDDEIELWQLSLATGAVQRFPLIKFYAEPRNVISHFELATDGSGLFLVSEYGEPEKPGKLSCFDIRTGARRLIAEGKFSDLSVRTTGVFACKGLSFRLDYSQVEREELCVGQLQQCHVVSFREVVSGITRVGGSIAYDLSQDGRRVVYAGPCVPLQSEDVRKLLAVGRALRRGQRVRVQPAPAGHLTRTSKQ